MTGDSSKMAYAGTTDNITREWITLKRETQYRKRSYFRNMEATLWYVCWDGL